MKRRDPAGVDERRAFLLQRVLAIAPFVLDDEDDVVELATRGPGPLLDAVARATKALGRDDTIWLALSVFVGVLPGPEEFIRFRRALELAEPREASAVFLAAGERAVVGFADLRARLDVVTDAVIVDVDFSARHAMQTGVQRVVRQTVSRWHRDHEVLPVAWSRDSTAMRRLSEIERERVIDYPSSSRREWRAGLPDVADVVVPFRSTVVLPEVPGPAQCGPLAALAAYSGNTVSVVGYDAIPVVSADTVPPVETARFVNYLAMVKHADRIVGISEAASSEFRGFVDALPAQGLIGPTVSTVSLPVEMPRPADPSIAATSEPLVLCVGSTEPRKNHLAVLHAAEVLWREGRSFTLRFIGGGNTWSTKVFDKRVRAAQAAGRSVELWRRASDEELIASYESARFLVFPSTHEGYGLPVAEALALGLPVITSSHGSPAEIARDGGCITVDPGDDEAIISAMRELFDSDERLAQLRAEAAARPRRSWDDYAHELWDVLVATERAPR